MKTTTKLWIGIAGLIILSPLGLILPKHFKSGSAWGEWGVGEISKFAGYVPAGMKKLSGLWKAPLPDYGFKGWEEKGLAHLSVGYIFSAVIGIAVVVLLMIVIGRILLKKKDQR